MTENAKTSLQGSFKKMYNPIHVMHILIQIHMFCCLRKTRCQVNYLKVAFHLYGRIKQSQHNKMKEQCKNKSSSWSMKVSFVYNYCCCHKGVWFHVLREYRWASWMWMASTILCCLSLIRLLMKGLSPLRHVVSLCLHPQPNNWSER